MKFHTSRFDCPSAILDIKILLRKTRYVWLGALILALAIHTAFTMLGLGLREEQKAVKPLTTQFIKRAPRLTKPLEMKKRPQPKRRRIQRRMVSVKARGNRQGMAVYAGPSNMIQNLARPGVRVGRTVAFEGGDLEAAAISKIIEGAKDPKQKVDMSLEMLDVEALDIGQYQAMVIQDPRDKRSVRGFFHVAIVGARTILDNSKTVLRRTHDFPRFINLIPKAMNEYTDIKTDVRGQYDFDSSKFLKTPFIFITSDVSFELTESEAANLGRYFIGGGFAFVEPAIEGINPGDVALRKMLKDALATQGYTYGRDWTFQIMPDTHAAYHCYFDFDGPPAGHDRYKRFPGTRDYLEEIVIHGRTICIYSNKDLEGAWSHDFPYNNVDNTIPHMFLVNLIIFSLTQEGSITNQIMDSVE